MIGHGAARIQAIAGLIAIAILVVVLRCLPPTEQSLYWHCPVYHFFGILCPGCGGTRAIAGFVMGQWDEALRQNLLVVVLSPCAAFYGALQAYSAIRWDCWRPVRFPKWTLNVLLLVAALFTGARNAKVLFR